MRLPASTFRWRALAALPIALLAAGGVAACQSTRAVSEMNAETRTRETIDLLEEGVTNIGLRAATRNVASWERRLRSEDVPALDDLADTLDDLEAELQADAIDGRTTGRILARLGKQTRAAARRDGAPARLDRLGQVLAETGEGLQ